MPKISALPAIVTVAAGDEFAVNDVSDGVARKARTEQVTQAVTTSLAAHVAASPIDHPAGSVGTAALAPLAVTTPIIDNDAVTPAKIPNRTRKFWVQPGLGYVVEIPPNGGADAEVYWQYDRRTTVPMYDSRGMWLQDGRDTYAYGHFLVPQDFVSALVVTAVVIPVATGDCYCRPGASYGSCGEAWDLYPAAHALAPQAVTMNLNNCIWPMPLVSAVAGSIVSVYFQRDATVATGGLDTVDADVYLAGWIVSYTADS